MSLRLKSALLLGFVLVTGVGFRVFLARADCTSGGADPGTVVVVGEMPVAVQFTVAAGIPCKLIYPANVAIWTSPLRTTAIPSGSVFTSGSGTVFGDANADGQVQLTDLIFIRQRLGTNNAACDLNANGVVDQNDLMLCRSALGSGPGQVTAYLEGLAASTVLCDTQVDLLTDPDTDGTFTLAESRRMTSISISVSPTTGGIGTAISISLQPAIPPLAFDSTTTAIWSGSFQPSSGSATPPFQVSFSSSELRESTASSAMVFIGEGTAVNSPALDTLGGTGTLNGTMALVFAGHTITRSFSFSLQVNGVTWEKLTYPIDYLEWTVGQPSLAGEPSHVRVLDWSEIDPVNQPSEDMLLDLRTVHHAAVLRIAETPAATAAAPDHVIVDIVTYDSSHAELDRRPGVRLDRLQDDSDPNFITYSSHLSKPIVLLDVPVNASTYSSLTVVHAAEGGYILAVPGTR